jgi:hypothetical protein
MTKPTKEKADSLYWQVEKWADDLQYRVAASHARRNNEVVIMTPRKFPTQQQISEDYGAIAAHHMSVISTKRQ